MSSVPNESLPVVLQSALKAGVADKIFSGAQAGWCVHGQPVCTVVAGQTRYTGGVPVTPDTLFDVASITKLFTATVALALVDRQLLRLTQSIWNSHSLEALLAHESGLPPWKPFFETVPIDLRGTSIAYQFVIEAVLSTLVDMNTVGTAQYSDIGYIGLGHQLQQLAGQSLQQLVKTFVTAPLGLSQTDFGNAALLQNPNVAATETCPWRKRTLQGEVHDDNAWTMGGIAGHAGIFSTAEDIVTFGEAWRKALLSGGFLNSHLARQAVSRRTSDRGLGFDLKSRSESSVGERASMDTFGHLGFTGTSLWIDPSREAVICLLTNRVHPSRDNNRIRAFRPYFHDLFFSAL